MVYGLYEFINFTVKKRGKLLDKSTCLISYILVNNNYLNLTDAVQES